MTENYSKLVIGGLLHDLGKVVYRCGDGRNHSLSGYEFLKDQAGLEDKEILNQVRHHHAGHLKGASIPSSSLAYITYQADNIAAGTDRRESTEGEDGFDKETPLASIFNLLNNNTDKLHYRTATLEADGTIHYPTGEPVKYDEAFYYRILDNIKDCLKGIRYEDNYLNSLQEVLEANLSFVPSSTSKREVADISLFDHVKLTAALGGCIYEYLIEKEITDYKTALFTKGKEFLQEKAFLIYSLDVSGIQSFIYTISSKGALKALRARSFYLELVMEHSIDEFLSGAGLSRVHLIYSGGGHAYLLLPNTKRIQMEMAAFEEKTNQWFMQYFQTALYLGGGCAECSANDLKNEPRGSYSNIFKEISERISKKKLARYAAKELIALNRQSIPQGERECSVCRRTDRLMEENRCEICYGLEQLSRKILKQQFFTVLNERVEGSLPLPGGRYLSADREHELKIRMLSEHYVRAYTKNEMYTGDQIATKLWVGDYEYAKFTDELAESAGGIKRLGVLRADVDNLGQAFVSGFEREDVKDRYVTLSRTATFSRKLSLFFKLNMNNLLQKGSCYLDYREAGEERKAMIVYSGGDDVFVIGSWDDIIGFAVDLYLGLKKFSQGTLTISAGIGVFPAKYPVAAMAKEVEYLEEASKAMEGKNAITLFSDRDHTYHWEAFINQVIGEKYKVIYSFFIDVPERGKNFLYHLIELMRNREDKINLARYAYLLARLRPEKKEKETEQEIEKAKRYDEFSRKMYQWRQNDEDCRQAITAMYLYAYYTRSREEEKQDEAR